MLSPAGWNRLQHLLYRGTGIEGIIHRYWRTGEILTYAISPHTPRHMQEGRISRVALHDILMKEVPEGVMTYECHVIKIENRAQGGMTIHFEDGQTEDADLVIAADGLYSVSLYHCLAIRPMTNLYVENQTPVSTRRANCL